MQISDAGHVSARASGNFGDQLFENFDKCAPTSKAQMLAVYSEMLDIYDTWLVRSGGFTVQGFRSLTT